MKTSIKILLLIVAVALAVGGVLYYMKTVVSPPQRLDYDNQFVAELDSIADSSESMTFGQLDEAYNPTLDLINRFCADNVLEPEASDKPMTKFMNNYAKSLSAEAHKLFGNSYWDHDRVVWFDRRIDSVSKYNLSDNITHAVNDKEVLKDFAQLQNIITKYYDARNIVRNVGYRGIAQSRNDIEKAEEYKQDIDLMPNHELVNGLENVRQSRARAHANYLTSRAYVLSNIYTFDSKSAYDSASSALLDEVIQYEQQGPSLYGSFYSSATANNVRAEISNANARANNHFSSSTQSNNYSW